MTSSSSVNQSNETRSISKESSGSASNEETKKGQNETGTKTISEQPVPIKKASAATNIDLRNRMASVTNLALENIGLDTKMEGPTWTSKWEAITASLSFVICSSNFWFFPYMCGYYGGLFPYQFSVCFLLIAVPLLYMEMALGQYASASPLSVFSRMVPAMAGLSAGMSLILVFRTISMSVWAIYDLTITAYATQAAWSTPPWLNCPIKDKHCVNYKLANCTWMSPGVSSECDQYQDILIANRGIQQRKFPFMAFIQRIMFKRSIIASDWAPPSAMSIGCAVALWILVGIVSIGGSKVLGRSGIVSLSLLLIGTLMLLSYGISLGDTVEVITAFFYPREAYADRWMWIWSWADAAAHALRSLNVACGGIQKFASLNKFNNKLHRDVLIISIVSYLFYMSIGLFSFMFMAKIGKYYYPDLATSERIELYTSPVLIEVVISELLTNLHLGSFWVFLFWLTLTVCSIQGIASYIWVISSMVLERLNGSRRKYGQSLASWHKRAVILAIMCLTGLVSSLPFLGNGGINLMNSIENFASYGALFIAFIEIITVSYLYGFKRFSVNIRAMIGGRGPPNIFWWLNWLVISPILLLILFGCVVSTFGKRKAIFDGSLILESIGYGLLVMPIIFVVFYFIREDCDRRKNMEPFVVMLRATGDWGPLNGEDRRKALKCERQLRVRY